MTSTRPSRTPLRRRVRVGAVAGALVGLLALAGCSGSGADGTSEAADLGAVEEAADAAGADGSRYEVESDSDRQVVTTGSVQLASDDPRVATDQVIDLVEGVDGRIDERFEQAATEEQNAYASLTVRVPSDDLTEVLDGLADIGEVLSVELSAQDVTSVAVDLDARIRSARLSVERLEALLADARTNADLIAAESALSDRQANLESMESERARLAEQVALSTISIDISTPADAPLAQTGPRSFWDGLGVGWDAFVSTVRGIMIALGVLLPWAVVAGAVTAAVVLVRRRRRVADAPGPTGPGGPGTPTGPGGPGAPGTPGGQAGPRTPEGPTPPAAPQTPVPASDAPSPVGAPRG